MNRSLPFALMAKLSATAASPAVALLSIALSLSVSPLTTVVAEDAKRDLVKLPVNPAGVTAEKNFAEDAKRDSVKLPGAAEPVTPAAAYGEMVRGSGRLEPQAQRQGFHVPEGFEVRLFASEPQIAKPLNMAIDAKGRVWLTQTTAYPYPAAEGANPGDAIKLLEDADADGQADRVTTFADGLNIPIGVLPYGDGCVAFSIPNLLYLRDTDGDGDCDAREVILGPFDTSRDTHGMVNALRDGGDGWIYACHGFNNRSVVKGRDGHEVRLESGNTFRFRPDGSRVEQYTQGQVNPFGMTRDDHGYWFTADCHSKPITQLIRGGCYPSFGRPHDGLGFLPPTIDHLHGSTAISGIVYIPADSSIVPLRGQLLSGNVMTSRINRDLLTYRGATAVGVELPDFLTSDDSWFRPVDLQLDPAGNIYIADFYNKIIGHYEVPLDHPDRDRTSGRIWQVRYTGVQADAPATAAADADTRKSSREKISALSRLGEAAASRRDAWDAKARELVAASLDDPNPHIARAAAEALGLADTSDDDTLRLFARLKGVAADDPVLRQTIRIAIRNRLNRTPSQSPLWQRILGKDAAADVRNEAASILPGVSGEQVVPAIVRYLEDSPQTDARKELVRHAVSQAGPHTLASVVTLARDITSGPIKEQSEMLDSIIAGQGGAKVAESDALRDWGLAIASASLAEIEQRLGSGQTSVGWTTTDGQPWGTQSRPFAGAEPGIVISSITRGESYVGKLVSDPFPAPAAIRFRLAGHGGHPDQPDHQKNLVRLVRVGDGAVLKQELTPRNDTAKLVDWDTSGIAGQRVRIECVDGDDGKAFAWLAVGEFEPDWIDGPDAGNDFARVARWCRQFELDQLVPRIIKLAGADAAPLKLRLEAAELIANLRGQNDWGAIFAAARPFPQSALAAGTIVPLFLESPEQADPSHTDESFIKTIRQATSQLLSKEESPFALAWIKSGGTPQRLLTLCEQGGLSPAVLVAAPVADVLRTKLDDAGRERFERLTANVASQPAVDPQTLVGYAEAIDRELGDPALGGALFTRHCAACHQLRGSGQIVGPQLDGVVTRTPARLMEDILTPDRNVDEAFRTTTLLLDDGRVIVGMIQTESADEIRLADSQGKTITVATAEIEKRVESSRSLMPGNFHEQISPADLANLIRFIRNP